jgi:hypothetical protein
MSFSDSCNIIIEKSRDYQQTRGIDIIVDTDTDKVKNKEFSGKKKRVMSDSGVIEKKRSKKNIDGVHHAVDNVVQMASTVAQLEETYGIDKTTNVVGPAMKFRDIDEFYSIIGEVSSVMDLTDFWHSIVLPYGTSAVFGKRMTSREIAANVPFHGFVNVVCKPDILSRITPKYVAEEYYYGSPIDVVKLLKAMNKAENVTLVVDMKSGSVMNGIIDIRWIYDCIGLAWKKTMMPNPFKAVQYKIGTIVFKNMVDSAQIVMYLDHMERELLSRLSINLVFMHCDYKSIVGTMEHFPNILSVYLCQKTNELSYEKIKRDILPRTRSFSMFANRKLALMILTPTAIMRASNILMDMLPEHDIWSEKLNRECSLALSIGIYGVYDANGWRIERDTMIAKLKELCISRIRRRIELKKLQIEFLYGQTDASMAVADCVLQIFSPEELIIHSTGEPSVSQEAISNITCKSLRLSGKTRKILLMMSNGSCADTIEEITLDHIVDVSMWDSIRKFTVLKKLHVSCISCSPVIELPSTLERLSYSHMNLTHANSIIFMEGCPRNVKYFKLAGEFFDEDIQNLKTKHKNMQQVSINYYSLPPQNNVVGKLVSLFPGASKFLLKNYVPDRMGYPSLEPWDDIEIEEYEKPLEMEVPFELALPTIAWCRTGSTIRINFDGCVNPQLAMIDLIQIIKHQDLLKKNRTIRTKAKTLEIVSKTNVAPPFSLLHTIFKHINIDGIQTLIVVVDARFPGLACEIGLSIIAHRTIDIPPIVEFYGVDSDGKKRVIQDPVRTMIASLASVIGIAPGLQEAIAKKMDINLETLECSIREPFFSLSRNQLVRVETKEKTLLALVQEKKKDYACASLLQWPVSESDYTSGKFFSQVIQKDSLYLYPSRRVLFINPPTQPKINIKESDMFRWRLFVPLEDDFL